VLDHDHGVPRLDQPTKDLEQALHVGEVQARGRLVEDVQRVARGHLRQLGGQLDPLGLPAGEGRRWLTQADVVQAHVVEGL